MSRFQPAGDAPEGEGDIEQANDAAKTRHSMRLKQMKTTDGFAAKELIRGPLRVGDGYLPEFARREIMAGLPPSLLRVKMHFLHYFCTGFHERWCILGGGSGSFRLNGGFSAISFVERRFPGCPPFLVNLVLA